MKEMGEGVRAGRRLFYVMHGVREGLSAPVFWAAVVLNTFAMYITCGLDMGSRIDILEGVQSAFMLGMASYYVPVCVSLPGVAGFFDEKSGGAYRYKLLRGRRLPYVLRKVAGSMLSGAAVMFFSFAAYTLAMLLAALKNGVPVTFSGIEGFYGEGNNIYARLAEGGRGWLVYLMQGSWLMFYAMIWPALGTAVSVFTTNRKVALASPFLLMRLLDYLAVGKAFMNFEDLRMTGRALNLPLGGYVYAVTYCLCVGFLCTITVYAGLCIFLGKNG